MCYNGGMSPIELFESQSVSRPEESPEYKQARLDQQYRELGKKLVELIRESPYLVLRFAEEDERAEHMQIDPTKPAPELHRLRLSVVRLEGDDRSYTEELHRIIARQQRQLEQLKRPSPV